MPSDEIIIKLHQCPFCKKSGAVMRPVFQYPLLITQLWQVECLHCGTKGPLRMTVAQARDAWNAAED